MNLGAEISHQYISSPSSLVTGQWAWGMSCVQVSRYPEVPRCLHLATDPSPWDTGQATCAGWQVYPGVAREPATISGIGYNCRLHMNSAKICWAFSMNQKHDMARILSGDSVCVRWGVDLGSENLGWVYFQALPLAALSVPQFLYHKMGCHSLMTSFAMSSNANHPLSALAFSFSPLGFSELLNSNTMPGLWQILNERSFSFLDRNLEVLRAPSLWAETEGRADKHF